ncbi:MAG: NAD-dependent epimerase/dehydratase family protein [Fibrobacter sp.]|nr:NAD-dependent epimerase/dehydratase family protein [Fibrobacter sp.]
MDLADKESIDKLFDEEKFDKVVNLAAQAGVRSTTYLSRKSARTGFRTKYTTSGAVIR